MMASQAGHLARNPVMAYQAYQRVSRTNIPAIIAEFN
jgi:hypothetical protein